MELTQKKLDNYFKASDEAGKLALELSDTIKEILEKKDKVKYNNKEGKEIEVLDKVALDEIKYLGTDCPAGKALRAKYPKLFELNEKSMIKKKEMMDLQVKTFGFTHEQMSLSNIIKLIQAIKCL